MKYQNRFNILLMLVLPFIVNNILFATNSYGANKMEPFYDIKEASEIKPQKFGLEVSTSISLFPVPKSNSVGTNDINNSITIISFDKVNFVSSLLSTNKNHTSFDKFFKNVVPDLGGSGVYLPIVSQDIIAFGQVRRFLIFDFKKKIYRKFRIAESIAETIEKAAIADSRQLRFIFEIEAQKSRSHDPWDCSNSLQLIDLHGKEPKLIKTMNIGNVTIWTPQNGKNFLYDLKTKKMQVLNMNLDSDHHPLVDLINHKKSQIDFTRIQPHPTLPFAILYGGRKGSTIVSWGEGRDHSPHPLINCTTQFSFSPDGKWVIFQKDFPDPKQTYLMPVSEKYPHYLGSPILLLDGYFNEKNFAWTTNPISFVGSRLNDLYRWELTKEAHPGIDRATFHDYIVDHDLEKLRKEKRQGLGK
jgi:hypothetical protein